MTVDEILAQVAQHGGRLLVAGDRLHVDAPEGAIPSELLDQIRANKQALLEQLRNHRQMCFNLVSRAVEVVAEHYPPGCLDALRSDDRDAVREAEGAMNAAALTGDLDATQATAAGYVDTWIRIIGARGLVADILSCTVDEWCARPDRPTIVLDTPNGEVLLVADRSAHAAAIEGGQVVLSPLEVEQLLTADNRGLVSPEFVRSLIATKRAMPGSRLEEVRGPVDEPFEEPELEEISQEAQEPEARPRRAPAKRTEAKPTEQEPAENPSGQLSLLGGR